MVTWTVKEVTELFNVTRSRVMKWLSDGRLSGEKRGNGRWVIPEASVEALFNRMAS